MRYTTVLESIKDFDEATCSLQQRKATGYNLHYRVCHGAEKQRSNTFTTDIEQKYVPGGKNSRGNPQSLRDAVGSG